jgi:hypothetical protein
VAATIQVVKLFQRKNISIYINLNS